MIVSRIILNVSRTALLLALMVMAACTHSELEPESRSFVPVTLNLSVLPVEDGMPGTKVDYEPDVDGYNTAAAIKTLLLLQFEWQDEDNRDAARLISKQFIPDGAPGKARLLASKAKNTLLIVANAWGEAPVAIGTTLGTFLEKENCNLLNSLNEMTGKGIWYSPNGGTDKYLRMSASLELPDGVGTNTAVGPVYLKRNCAKVVINLKNSSNDPDKVNIEKVQLRCINRKYYYVTNCTGFSDTYSSTNPYRFDDPERDFPAAYNTSGDTQSYIYYIPASLRGTVANASQALKNFQAIPGATYFCVYATYDSSAKNVTYTYYLGADLTSDFNLEPNKKYIYNIDLNGKGNSVTDFRIEDINDVKFTKDANCYMLRPPSRPGSSATYSIPVRRAAVFWNGTGQPFGVYGAADREAYELLEATEWKAFLVWNDVTDKEGSPVPDSELLTGSQYDSGEDKYVVTGLGFNPANTKAFIKIKVTAGMRGNALVAIKKTSQPTLDDILWSWQLWVTDYYPYVDMTPVAGTYVYSLPTGEIHRYADRTTSTLWTSGDYANAFIMDRNLGALSSLPEEMNSTSALGCFYQFGRKDPFRTNVDPPVVAADMTGQPDADEMNVTVKKNIRYSIHNPDLFINGNANNWTAYESDMGTSAASWIDPRKDLHDDDPSNPNYDYCEPGKSVYDPCPYGWQVPVQGTWLDFVAATLRWAASPLSGIFYYPEGYDSAATKGRIYLPASGYRRHTRAGANYGYYWTENVYNANQGKDLRFNSSNGTSLAGVVISGDYRSNGFVIRCVRLSHTLPY